MKTTSPTDDLREEIEATIISGMPFLSPTELDAKTMNLVIIAAQNKIPDLIKAREAIAVIAALMKVDLANTRTYDEAYENNGQLPKSKEVADMIQELLADLKKEEE